MSIYIYGPGLALMVCLIAWAFIKDARAERAERQEKSSDFKTTIGCTADAMENDLPAL